MNKILEYLITAKDLTADAIKSAVEKLKQYQATVQATMRDVATRFKDSYGAQIAEATRNDKAHWKMIAAREAEKRAVEKQKREEEELTAALKRQADAVDRSIAAQKARMEQMKSKGWNGSKEVVPASSGGGFDAASLSLSNFASQTKKALPSVTALSASIGMMDGAVGKLARGISGIAGMTMMFGPLGAAIAGAQYAISMFADHFKQKADEMLQKTLEWSEGVRRHLANIRERDFKKTSEEIKNMTDYVNGLNESFERHAKKREALLGERNGKLDALDAAKLIRMEDDMNADVAAASDDDKARVQAAWRLEIAKETAAVEQKRLEREQAAEAQAMKTAQERLELAKKNQEIMNRNVEKAYDELSRRREIMKNYDDSDDQYDVWKAEVDRYQQIFDEAGRASKNQSKMVEALTDEIEVMEAKSARSAAERANVTAKMNNQTAKAQDEYLAAEDEYAKKKQKEADDAAAKRLRQEREEEKARLEAERKIAQARLRELHKEFAARREEESKAASRLAAAEAKAQQAWGWYRNRDSWKAQLEEERANAEAEKQFAKDAERLTSRTGWRSAKLNDDDELIRRVVLAREEEANARLYAKQTAEATARTAEAVEKMEAAINGEE